MQLLIINTEEAPEKIPVGLFIYLFFLNTCLNWRFAIAYSSVTLETC